MKNYKNIYIIGKVYLLVISLFFLFRFLLFLTELDRVSFDFETNIITLKSFWMGIRFDLAVSGYILLLPALIFSILEIVNKYHRIVYEVFFYWIFILFVIFFAVCAADIPYFNQFFSRFSMGAFEWIDSPLFVFNMVIEEPKYFLILVPWFLLMILFYKVLRNIFNFEIQKNITRFPVRIVMSVLFLGVIFLGIRGRVEEKSPIRVGTAYFSNHPFLNQLGLNPVYTLLNSYLSSKSSKNKKVNLIDKNEAIQNVQSYLKIQNVLDDISPIARKVTVSGLQSSKKNVVVILMESMSADHMSRHGSGKNITPFLDSLSNKSIYFDNFYTAGKHTHNGIFSTLFSFPALFRQHQLKTMRNYHGIASVLKNNGYSTAYFTTHDGQFDNVEGFLKANDYDLVNDVSAYPSKEVKTTLGVPDDYMFRFSIDKLNRLDKAGKPFFVNFMTASDHGPFYIPEYFTPNTISGRDCSVEYADWSIKQFFKLAKQQPWFEDTIFVLLADHGLALNTPYDISLGYHHSPLIIYNSEFPQENFKTIPNISGQIDVFPTIMGLLNMSYINNTLGVDLLRETKPYTIINDDDKVGVLDNNYLMILNDREEKKLYHYKDLDTKNYAQEYPEKVEQMSKYLGSNLQVFQSMLVKQQLSID